MIHGGVLYFLCNLLISSYKHINVWGLRIDIINGHVIRRKRDNRSHYAYFVGYADTALVIIYYNQDQNFYIHRAHHDWFDEYNYCLSIEDNYTPSYLLLLQDTENLLRDLDLLNLIQCKLYLIFDPFCDTTMIKY